MTFEEFYEKAKNSGFEQLYTSDKMKTFARQMMETGWHSHGLTQALEADFEEFFESLARLWLRKQCPGESLNIVRNMIKIGWDSHEELHDKDADDTEIRLIFFNPAEASQTQR
jgi:hypothetical protein